MAPASPVIVLEYRIVSRLSRVCPAHLSSLLIQIPISLQKRYGSLYTDDVAMALLPSPCHRPEY
ncbi:hypothetical protein HPP92_020817 [Vanilla planifolia]|uniref:Uncharacterized protein n=1 Tax=Vanilla planifolia TaxID=51239 RepID=A0A835PUG3_VANPL|nr:hypothetical protein HPP92_020817 [Vanilla planifolia]